MQQRGDEKCRLAARGEGRFTERSKKEGAMLDFVSSFLHASLRKYLVTAQYRLNY